MNTSINPQSLSSSSSSSNSRPFSLTNESTTALSSVTPEKMDVHELIKVALIRGQQELSMLITPELLGAFREAVYDDENWERAKINPTTFLYERRIVLAEGVGIRFIEAAKLDQAIAGFELSKVILIKTVDDLPLKVVVSHQIYL